MPEPPGQQAVTGELPAKFLKLIAAFKSLSRGEQPQSHEKTLSDNERTSFTVPQLEQVLLDGKNLSAFIS